MASTGYHDIYTQYWRGLQLKPQLHLADSSMTLCNPVGAGVIRRLSTNTKLEIVHSDYRLSRLQDVYVTSEAAMVELSICLQGAGQVNVSGERHDICEGTCYLHFMKQFDAVFEYDNRVPMRSLAIGIPLVEFNRLMGEGTAGRTMDFDRIIGSQSFRKFELPINTAAAHIVRQMLECPYEKAVRRMYLEGKALELLANYMHTFLFDSEEHTAAAKLSKRDMDKVKEAAQVLLYHMESPPSLLELARIVGLNDFKLKLGFKECFGTSAYRYLRDKRLEQAMNLLRKGDVNVTQAAGFVGYANLSHFTAIFRGKFGLNPSEVLRQRR
ncbi:AraC family transcriptional regulator [Paenibacillus sp. ACRRX]|uniref:helix-turn-helix transcriptional regulator n=1 Tax=Paenibacillus sp. ACRRX TaxID=2918206 RepID=UPI001EF5CCBD|nr:AraC family transcriptional regulator [Paenibacillus sp. ACRRX]MCG7409183.1 AraC family transcriptional regulator [Paenibacillus sp. ACRRX]